MATTRWVTSCLTAPTSWSSSRPKPTPQREAADDVGFHTGHDTPSYKYDDGAHGENVYRCRLTSLTCAYYAGCGFADFRKG